MWTIMFTAPLIMVAIGMFDNAPIGWKIVIGVIIVVAQSMLLYNDFQQEKLEDRVKSLENKVKELVGEDK